MSSPIAAHVDILLCANGRAAIEGKIVALREQIRSLSQELNELTPVGRLSSELLVDIFSYLQRECCSGSNEEVPFLLKITHVSHRWRAISLGCPSLWTAIFFPNKTYIGEWLERSRSSKLYVTLNTKYSREALELALGQLHRIRDLRLHIKGGVQEAEPAIFQFPDVPATALTVLGIQGVTSNPPFSLPFLSRSFPALDALVIRTCGVINLASPIFVNLTFLTVEECSIQIPMTDLLSQLLRMPRLTTLKLGTVTLLPSMNDGALPTVELLALRNFVYHGTDGSLDFLFLSHLTFPRKPSFQFTFHTTIPDTPDVITTSSTLPTMFTAVEELWKEVSTISTLGIRLSDDVLVFRTHNTCIRITSPSISIIYDKYMAWISEHLPLFETLVKLGVAGPVNPSFWPVLMKLTSLRVIKIESEQSGDFFGLFIRDAERNRDVEEEVEGQEDAQGLVLPHLRQVLLNEANFENITGVVGALRYRCDHGHKLPWLVLKDSYNIGSELVGQLSEVVERVDWDGRGESDSEGDEDPYGFEAAQAGGGGGTFGGGPITLCNGCGQPVHCTHCN